MKDSHDTPPPPEPETCLVWGCVRLVRCRGLCNSCYSRASTLVSQKLTTWKKLEKEQKVLPAKRRGRSGKVTRYFLG